MRATKTRNAFRAGMAEAAEILTRRADQLRRDGRHGEDHEKVLVWYTAALALTKASQEIPDERVDELLERASS